MIKHSLTPKQQTIILFLYRFRFLNRIQIQTILKHKTFNRVNLWLKELYKKQYIGRILDTKLKINNTPATYYLGKNAIRFLKTKDHIEKSYLSKLYNESTRSEEFIKRCLFIANTYIDLQKKYLDTTFKFYTQSDYTINGLIKEISPSFVYRKEKTMPLYIAEIFKEEIPRYAVRSRVSKYIEFFTQDTWLENEEPPNILFITPEGKLEKYILQFSEQQLKEKQVNVFVTTIKQIKTLGIEGEIWTKVEKQK